MLSSLCGLITGSPATQDRLLNTNESERTHILAVVPRVEFVGCTRGDVICQLDHRRPLVITALNVILMITRAVRYAVRR